MKRKKQGPLIKLAKVVTLIALSALTFTSCGKKNNADPKNVATPYAPPAFNSLKSQSFCPNGRQRIGDIPLSMSSGQSQGNSLSGVLQPNHVGGTVVETYIGVHKTFKDLLVITKVDNGGRISFNLTLSLCSYQSTQGVWHIGGGAQLSNFVARRINLSSNLGCLSNNVDKAIISFSNSSFGQDGREFTRIACRP